MTYLSLFDSFLLMQWLPDGSTMFILPIWAFDSVNHGLLLSHNVHANGLLSHVTETVRGLGIRLHLICHLR